MIPPVVLPITLTEFGRDGEELDRQDEELARLEGVLNQDIRVAHRELAEAKADLDLARRDAWKSVEGRNRDERHTQVEVLVAEEKKRIVDLEGRVAAGKAFSFVLSSRSSRLTSRSMRLTTAARFAMRQMELDTPEPDRAPHWERTTA